jgi:hypothetical protein
MPLSLRRRGMSFASLGVDDKGRGRGGETHKHNLPNFTGTWKQVGNERANEYMKAMGYSYPARQFALLTMNSSTDVVLQDGDAVHMQTVNKRGEWQRTYIENEEVPITTTDGQEGNTTAWWEKDETLGTYVHKTRTVGAKQGVMESWRWLVEEEEVEEEASQRPQLISTMVVKSIVYPADKKGESTCMYWRFKPVEPGASECMLKNFEETYVKALQPITVSNRAATETEALSPLKKNTQRAKGRSSNDTFQVMSSPNQEHLGSWLERFSDYYYLLVH